MDNYGILSLCTRAMARWEGHEEGPELLASITCMIFLIISSEISRELPGLFFWSSATNFLTTAMNSLCWIWAHRRNTHSGAVPGTFQKWRLWQWGVPFQRLMNH